MRLFAVFGTDPGQDAGQDLARRIAEHFPGNHLEVGAYQWVIATNDTVQNVAEKINGDEHKTRLIVAMMSSYWGHHNRSVWDWLSVKGEEDG